MRNSARRQLHILSFIHAPLDERLSAVSLVKC